MTSNDIAKTVAEASPPVAYATLHLLGVSLPDWVAIATLGYIALQAAHLIWRWYRAARRNNVSGD